MKYAKTLLLPLAGVIMNNFLPFYRKNMILKESSQIKHVSYLFNMMMLQKKKSF